MLSQILLTTGIALIIYAFYKFVTKNEDFFSKKGIKQMRPSFLFGNSGTFIKKNFSATEFSQYLYYAFPNEKLVIVSCFKHVADY